VEAPELSAYTQAVDSGQYVRATGLAGKYDNVRTRWEDEITRMHLRPHLEPLVARRLREGRKIRILDLGCGSGDGFELLMQTTRADPGLHEHEIRVVLPDSLGLYRGIDINDQLLVQARQRHGAAPNVLQFETGDIRNGLPVAEGDPPYDVYFMSFGTLSHLTGDQTERLLADIAKHADDGSLLLCDWLGRHAYEWRDLWDADLGREKWMDYRISYIHPLEERSSRKVDSFALRLLSSQEIRALVARAQSNAEVALREKVIFDRSLFVGRHMDTGDYNPDCVPLRARVNTLHEPYHRTDLDSLCFEVRPRGGFDGPNRVLARLNASWNLLVRFVQDLVREPATGPTPAPATDRVHLARAMETMRAAIEASRSVEMDDPRANLIEPQLGYALRDLEIAHQTGEGCGHGVVGIFEVHKRRHT
jgi:SAM-dependent methyltransferase